MILVQKVWGRSFLPAPEAAYEAPEICEPISGSRLVAP